MLSVKQLFIYLCIHSFHSFIRSFGLSFVRSFLRSFVRSFVHLFTHYVNIFWDELITSLKFLPTLILKIFYLAIFCPDNDDNILVNYIILESKYLIFRSKLSKSSFTTIAFY